MAASGDGGMATGRLVRVRQIALSLVQVGSTQSTLNSVFLKGREGGKKRD